jgi:hypothetical protein
MLDHRQYCFEGLRDWLYFCEQVQDAVEVEFSDLALAPDVEQIQHAARLLATAVGAHEDGLALANLWLGQFGPWRLVREPSALSQRWKRPAA